MIPAWFDVGVLTIVTLVLLALAVWRIRFVYSPRGSWKVALAFFLVPGLAFGWAVTVEVRHQWTQERATAVTRELTGNPDATASCERYSAHLFNLSHDLGHVMSDEPNVAHLRRDTCNDFADWLLSDKHDPSAAQVQALHVVVHEAMHVGGQYNEAMAECSAMQHDAEAAEFLGASPADARALAESYYQTVYPLMPTDYRTGDCSPDGSLDLSPGDGQFP